jgi:phosphatidate cytidylyltransferase
VKSQGQLRILTALILLAVTLAAIFALPSDVFFLVVVALVTAAGVELVRMLRHWAPQAPFGLLLLLLPVLTLAAGFAVRQGLKAPPEVVAAVVWGGVVLAAALLALWRSPIAEAAPAMGFMTFSLIYLAVPALCLYHLHRVDPWLVLALVALVGLGDSAAYYVGTAIGRHKMAPQVSPKKSWEGSAAGFLAAILTMAVWCLVRRGGVDAGWLAAAAAAAAAAQTGDLIESLIKRGAGVKDSSQILPGHGGIYDRIDALLLAAPVFLLVLWGLGLAGGKTLGTPSP